MGWLANLWDIASVVLSDDPAAAAQRANQRITQRIVVDSVMNPKKQQTNPNVKLTRTEIGRTAARMANGASYFRVQPRSCIHYTPKDIIVEFYNRDRRCIHQETYSHRELAKYLEADILYEL